MLRITATAALLGLMTTASFAAPDRDDVTEISDSVGEMSTALGDPEIGRSEIDNAIRFEPIQNFGEMFLRDDVVFLMRHGPTDWSKLDEKDVAPDDCENQRILSDEGRADMRDLGSLLAHNDIGFGQVVVSEWCRNQQTVSALGEGYERLEPGVWGNLAVKTRDNLNLLLSLQGARTVSGLEDLVSSWDGGDGKGPLLVVTHFTNIQELTEFSVYEGEILVLDPKRDNRVLGYVRLRNAKPDVGHFDVEPGETPADSATSEASASVSRTN